MPLKIDKSIFEDVREDVAAILKRFTVQKVEEAELYIVDKEGIDELKICQKRLEMEYKPLGEDLFKKFALSTIVKVINQDKPANWFKTFVDESWKQVNDRELVKERLDKELARYKAILMSNVRKKIKEKEIDAESAKRIFLDIETKEFPEAERECEYIKENFDELDVRISTYYERTKYGAVQFTIDGKKQQVNLRKKIPNALWYQKQEKKRQKNNELLLYLSKAKRAFGDVFYVPKSEYLRDPNTIRKKKKGDGFE